MDYVFSFNLEKGEETHYEGFMASGIFWGIHYYLTEKGIFVKIGDGYRHELDIEGEHWDNLLGLIKSGKLSDAEIYAITRGLLSFALPLEYESSFLEGIRSGKIKEVAPLAKSLNPSIRRY